ncbi:MAG TPA: zinc-binding alcohol dehydrogenase family protein [Burkholderiales bacterium]|jgi:zinc-binding alcohol dehydrogenase family protein|nr:zinc-binding alcohol dehydrogenase family protein [Burkholderiales bacterium]HEX2649949.1 zinc-binding alcohol dehydrogenase family protein [Burkholderiales bacterium]
MKAVGLYRYLPIEHPESLLDLEVETPRASGRDLLVEVKAVSVNPVDTKRRAPGLKNADTVELSPKILGFDAAGVVKAAGLECSLFRPGDAVYYAGSVVRQGTNSELHLVDERIVGRKPANLSFAEAAALPLTTLTAWELMFERMGISRTGSHAGASLLILNGAGGVGSIAIQLAKKLARLQVTATASRPESIAWVKELGADNVVDHTRPIEGEFDFVLCLSSSDFYWKQFPDITKPQGKIGLIVRTLKPVDLQILHDKSLTICLEGMFTRSTFQTPDMEAQHKLLNEAAGLVEAGVLRHTLKDNLGRICAEHLKRAHQRLEGGHAIGKLVLEGF